jgi:hypothetical protein
VVWGLVALGSFSPNAATGLKGLIMKEDENGFFIRGCRRVVGGSGDEWLYAMNMDIFLVGKICLYLTQLPRVLIIILQYYYYVLRCIWRCAD